MIGMGTLRTLTPALSHGERGEFGAAIFVVFSKFIGKTTEPIPSPVGEG